MTRTELGTRLCAYLFGLGVPAAVLSPLLCGAPDSFPLSTYPMFAQTRGQATLYVVVAIASDGQEQRLPPPLIGTKEVLQAKVLIQRAVDGGPETMAQLCDETAARVAATSEFQAARAVAIVQRRYDPIDYFVKSRSPLAQRHVYECAIPALGVGKGETP